MGDISRVALFGKLDPLAFKAMESAAAFCKLRGNPYVELAHWIHQILQSPASDLHLIVRAFDLDAAALARDLTASLDRLPRGATAITDLSGHLEDATERAWVWTTLKFGASQVRTAHLLVAMLKTRDLRNALLRAVARVRQGEGRCARGGFAANRERFAGERGGDCGFRGRPGDRADGRVGQRLHSRPDGRPGHASALHGRPHRAGHAEARSIRSLDGTRKSASSSTF